MTIAAQRHRFAAPLHVLVWLTSLAVALFVASSARASDEAASGDEVASYDDEPEYCGGGEPTKLDVAYGLIGDGEPERAIDLLADALRAGEIEAWARPQALALLAEAQLAVGQVGLATTNYRRALALDEATAGPAARVGLAIALYRAGDPGDAEKQARRYLLEHCASSIDDELACFGAYEVLSRTTGDAFEMLDAMYLAREILDGSAAPTDFLVLRDRIDEGAPPRPDPELRARS